MTDSGQPAQTTQVSLLLNVVDTRPALGQGDANGNGIPAYQDGGLASNLLPSLGGGYERYLVEAEPGVKARLGPFALGLGLGGSLVNPSLLPQADGLPNVGGLHDFTLLDLPRVGQSVSIVLPQQAAIPEGARYRKYDPRAGLWYDFVLDGHNHLASAPGEPGYCPPPGDAAYLSGLNPGHWCVQLTVEDGGPNDADGVANGQVSDPGGVAGAADAEPPPRRGGGGAVGLLGLLMLGAATSSRRRRDPWLCSTSR